MLDRYEREQHPAAPSAQYFKSQVKRTAESLPSQKLREKPVGLYDRAIKLQEKRKLLQEQSKL